MSMKNLPQKLKDVIERNSISEFATVSAAGIPIDTPTFPFAREDLALIGIATGLAYPAKAERARRNSKVGMLFEGGPGQPVISIRGRAAVRDADLQANALRYLSESNWDSVGKVAGVDWPVTRQAVWYWTRIVIEIMPEQILWWDNFDAMDSQPNVVNYLVSDDFVSDPKPEGQPSPAAKWPQKPWQELAAIALGRNVPAHLTLVDDDGWPLPIRVKSKDLIGDRFKLEVPKGAPWKRAGKASLSFLGVENFIGEVEAEGDTTWLTVERALPVLPMMLDSSEVARPKDDTRKTLMARLEEECLRRGQPIPTLPFDPPVGTRMAQVRLELRRARGN